MTLEEIKFSALTKTIFKASFMSPDVFICIRDMMRMSNDELQSFFNLILKKDNDFTGVNYILMNIKMQHITMDSYELEGISEFASVYEKTTNAKFCFEPNTLDAVRWAIKDLFDKDPGLVTKEREDDLVFIYSNPLDDRDIDDIKKAVENILKSFK